MHLRDKKYSIYFSKEEYRIFCEQAEKYRKNKAEYFRDVILFSTPVVVDIMHQIDAKTLISELNDIGNRINEIARNTNEKRGVSEADFKALQEAYEEFLSVYIRHFSKD